MSYISVDYAEGRRQGARIEAMAKECAKMREDLSAAGVDGLEELDALAADLEAIGKDMTAECDRLQDIENTMFKAHRGGGNSYV